MSGFSKEQIEDLLVNVLDVTKMCSWKGNKIQFTCPVHGERHPSCGIDIDYCPDGEPDLHGQVFNCFDKDTQVITHEGVKPIKELLKSPCKIINGKGEWEEVRFKRFGIQRLMKVTLTSNSQEKVIYATPNHRWFVQRRKSEVTTNHLHKGQRLERMWLKPPQQFILDNSALLHGFIYGDGTLNKNVKCRKGYFNHTVALCSDLKYAFCRGLNLSIKQKCQSDSESIRGRVYSTTPYNQKKLPQNSSLNYIFSFLAGYFVADGNCTHQCVTISSTNFQELIEIKHLFTLVGIATYPIRKQERTASSNMGVVKDGQTHTQYILGIVKSTIPKEFWVSNKRPESNSTYKSYLGYVVKSVEYTDRVAPVYCCQTSTGSFVLDGFILTGNCFSCGESGSISWLVYRSLPDRFKSVAQAEKFLRQRYGVTARFLGKDNSLMLHRYEDKFVDLDKVAKDKEVKPLSTIAPFKSGKETYQYFFDRGFDKEDMKKFMIGRDLKEETVTIPIFWEDKRLAGVIGRYIDPDRPKNSRFKIYEFRRSSLIYPLDKVETVDNTLILVEACFDVIMLNKWGFPNAIATMTNKVSKEQAKQIKDRCTKLIVLCDLDERGKKLLETAEKFLKKEVQIYLPTYTPTEGKDPCEWGELETVKVIESAKYLGVSNIPRL